MVKWWFINGSLMVDSIWKNGMIHHSPECIDISKDFRHGKTIIFGCLYGTSAATVSVPVDLLRPKVTRFPTSIDLGKPGLPSILVVFLLANRPLNQVSNAIFQAFKHYQSLWIIMDYHWYSLIIITIRNHWLLSLTSKIHDGPSNITISW